MKNKKEHCIIRYQKYNFDYIGIPKTGSSTFKTYNYNITVIAKAAEFELPTLTYDNGDIIRLNLGFQSFVMKSLMVK